MGNIQEKEYTKGSPEYTRLMRYVHNNIIGDGTVFNGPYGRRSVIYCDYTASGRPLRCIEQYITKYVLQFYANTHTSTCITAQQTTQFRHDAKLMIKKAVNASSDDVVIFTGSGTTGAIHKLIGVLGLKEHAENTVVFISPFEHHSNLLPWMECKAEVIRVPESCQGTLDTDILEQYLKENKTLGKKMIASFNAASNITGIMTDTVAVAELCHKYGALSFWDYATAGPYLDINMNASELGYKDAVFASPHKFVGGPGTPGILIAKKSLFTNPVPHNAGGGTVLYVIKDRHVYLDDIESREEGGTPAIIESIRAGLCFQLKQDVGSKAIELREEVLYNKARAVWANLSNMVILGSGDVKRLPIFSFVVRYKEGSNKYLHHNFLARLLNDLFGIQARGGCACAGPYAEGLLGINGKDFTVFLENEALFQSKTHDTKNQSLKSLEIMKPGFVRINLPYFMNENEFDYVISSVSMLTQHAWKLLPLYSFNPKSGEWNHRTHPGSTMHLDDISFLSKMNIKNHPASVKVIKMGQKHFKRCLAAAKRIFNRAERLSSEIDTSKDEKMVNILPENKTNFCWFVEPWEAAVDLALSHTQYTVENLSKGIGKKTLPQLFHPNQMSALRQKPTITKQIFGSLKGFNQTRIIPSQAKSCKHSNTKNKFVLPE